MKFYELAIGAVFSVRGVSYRKTAMSMAEDERHWGHVFMGETEVVSAGPLLAPEVAARWNPERLPMRTVTSCPSAGHNQQDASPAPG